MEFIQCVNFEFNNSFKKQFSKNLLFFDDLCEKLCHSKTFLVIAPLGTHRGLSTRYIQHNLFHLSEFERDVELQICSTSGQSSIWSCNVCIVKSFVGNCVCF